MAVNRRHGRTASGARQRAWAIGRKWTGGGDGDGSAAGGRSCGFFIPPRRATLLSDQPHCVRRRQVQRSVYAGGGLGGRAVGVLDELDDGEDVPILVEDGRVVARIAA